MFKWRDFLLQPQRKVLAKTTGIDEVWLHFPEVEQFSLDCNQQIHSAPSDGSDRLVVRVRAILLQTLQKVRIIITHPI
jgi:hypothetical protein